MQIVLALAPLFLIDFKNAVLLPPVLSTDDELYEAGALLSGLGKTKVRSVWLHFKETRELYLEEPFARGPGPLSKEEELHIEDQIQAWVRTELMASDEPAWITRQNVKDKVRELTGYDLSFEYIGLLCHQWGLDYGRLGSPPHAVSLLRKIKRRLHVLVLASLISTANYDIYDADQSYIGVRDTHMMSFYISAEPWGKFGSTRKSGAQGDRLCFMHAIGPKGMAGAADTCASLGDTTSPEPNCWMAFAAIKKIGDYHGNFNAGIFMAWVKLRFFEYVKATYPGIDTLGYAGKKVCLTIDNAAYQCATTEDMTEGEERFNPLKLSIAKLVECMIAIDCEELDIPFLHQDDAAEDQLVFTLTMNEAAKKHKGLLGARPSVAEVKLAAFKWCIEHRPMVLENDVEAATRQAFGDNVIIIYNAPAWPKRMRIEDVWGITKCWTRYRRTKNRAVTDLDVQVREALYTRNLAKPGTNQFHGGNYVPDETGVCASLDALTRHCWTSSDPDDDGNVQSVINEDIVLRNCGPADGAVPTLNNLTVPDNLAPIVACRQRNVINWYVTELVTAEDAAAFAGGVGDALDRADDADGDDEEDED